MANLNFVKTKGRGDPVIFLHGLMDSAESYLDIGHSLSRPTIAIDLPGFGDSPVNNSEKLSTWASRVEQVIENEVKNNYFLVGHSLGGAVASEIANRDNQKIRGLCLIASAGYARIPLARPLTFAMSERILEKAAPIAMSSEVLIKSFYWGLFSHRSRIDSHLLKRLVESRQKSVPGARQAMRIIQDLSDNPFLKNNYSGPVQAIWGDSDFLTPTRPSIKRLEAIFDDPEVDILKDTGHHPQDEKRAEVVSILKRFSAS